ncbi:MAG: CHRD domain-containing protein [Phycisphaerae bacterium]|nr:CHRD domain-containing protein [Phycisphaerae bacterium]
MKQIVVMAIAIVGVGLMGCGKKAGAGYQGDGYYYSGDSGSTFQRSGQPQDNRFGVHPSGRAMFDSSACNPHPSRSAFAGERTAKSDKGECKPCKCKDKDKAKTETKPQKGQAFQGKERCECEGSRSFFSDLEPSAVPQPIGMARVTMVTGVVRMSYRIDVGNAENITGAYIHVGETDGRLGPVVATLYKGEPKSGSFRESLAAGTLTADRLMGPMQGKDLSTLADEIRRGNAFVRITTTERPEGILAGRLSIHEPPADTRDQFMGEAPRQQSNPANRMNESKQPSDANPPAGARQPADSTVAPTSATLGAVFVPIAAYDSDVKDKAAKEGKIEDRHLFAGEERGMMFTSVLTPPSDMPDAKAMLWLGANKEASELRYHLTLKDVKDPKGANLYLVEKSEKATGEKGEKALDRAEKAVEHAGEKAKEAVHEMTHKAVDKLGEPIAKLTIKGEVKSGAFSGVFAEGTLSKDDLTGALKGKDLSVLIDHIRQGHVYVAVLTEKDPTGKFQGVVHLRPAMEKHEKGEKEGAGFKGEEQMPAKPATPEKPAPHVD